MILHLQGLRSNSSSASRTTEQFDTLLHLNHTCGLVFGLPSVSVNHRFKLSSKCINPLQYSQSTADEMQTPCDKRLHLLLAR